MENSGELPILVTGALGNAGAEVVKALLAKGYKVRAADPDETKLKERFGGSVDAVRFNFFRSGHA